MIEKYCDDEKQKWKNRSDNDNDNKSSIVNEVIKTFFFNEKSL